jgi:hypothetical protein
MDAKEEKALANIAPDTFDCFDYALECLADVLDGVEDVAKLVLSYATPCDGYSKKPHNDARLPTVAVTMSSLVMLFLDGGLEFNFNAWTTFLIRPIPICGHPFCRFHEYGSFDMQLDSVHRKTRFEETRPTDRMMREISFHGTMLFTTLSATDTRPKFLPLPDAWRADKIAVGALSIPLQVSFRACLIMGLTHLVTIHPVVPVQRSWSIVIFDDEECLIPSLERIQNECRSAWRDLEPHVS